MTGQSSLTGETDAIAEALHRHCDLRVEAMERIARGHGGHNYRVQTNGGTFFIKLYLPGADLDAEHDAIALSERARSAGLPTAVPHRFSDGRYLVPVAGTAMAVWSCVAGETRVRNLSDDALFAIGYTLARVHVAFVDHPLNTATPVKTKTFLNLRAETVRGQIDQIEQARTAKPHQTEFDIVSAEALTERRGQLDQLAPLLSELPPLRSQVIHGDYTMLNLLMIGDEVNAVLDFRPPDPFLISWELGRVAFSPDVIAAGGDWMHAARQVIAGYVAAAPPGLPTADIRAAGRVATIQLLKSVYGVKQHYLAPALRQDDLDRFWLKRHASVTTLLHALPQIDAMLVDVTS